jgi:hypothetical protein
MSRVRKREITPCNQYYTDRTAFIQGVAEGINMVADEIAAMAKLSKICRNSHSAGNDRMGR